MKSYYEYSRDEEKSLHINKNQNHDYPAHFHLGMEIFIVKSGKYSVIVNGKDYTVSNGCILVCDSFDIHSYQHLSPIGEDLVLIVPYSYLTRFNSRRRGAKISSPLIVDEKLCEKLIKLVDEYLTEQTSEEITKATVELFLATLEQKINFTESKEQGESALIREILAYIQENFRKDTTRKAIAKALGYTEAHISRVFHKYLRTNVNTYVNDLRLNYLNQQLKDDDSRTVTELIYESGFKSQQTYYRVKKAHENS